MKLRQFDELPASDYVQAAFQFVQKISGFRQPSRANQAAFDAAVEDLTQSSTRQLMARTSPSALRTVA